MCICIFIGLELRLRRGIKANFFRLQSEMISLTSDWDTWIVDRDPNFFFSQMQNLYMDQMGNGTIAGRQVQEMKDWDAVISLLMHYLRAKISFYTRSHYSAVSNIIIMLSQFTSY